MMNIKKYILYAKIEQQIISRLLGKFHSKRTRNRNSNRIELVRELVRELVLDSVRDYKIHSSTYGNLDLHANKNSIYRFDPAKMKNQIE